MPLKWTPIEGSDHDLLLVARALRSRGATEADAAGADELLQAVWADELLERVELLRRACQLEDDRVGAEIRDPRAEHVGERHQLAALAGGRGNLQQRELALDRFAGRQLLHTQHVHQ